MIPVEPDPAACPGAAVIVYRRMNKTKRIVATVLLTGAVVAVGAPTASAHNILDGIGLIGSNGNADSDDSNSQNVVANGKQFVSGIGVSNSPALVVGDTINDFQTVAAK